MLVERGDSRAAIAALEALSAVAKDAPEMMIFLDVEDKRTAGLWRAARRLGLLDRLSMVPELEARREPALQLDAVLLPDAAGVSHSFVLDCMAGGLSVLAAPDPLVESLIDARTARLVVSPTKAEWERALRDTVLDAERWSLLGASAREYIRGNRSVSGHIGAVLEAYTQAQRLHAADQAQRKAVA
jgi:glycosyltransferase involved in cell wall biosynthesis